MVKYTVKALEEMPPVLSAPMLAKALSTSRSGAYALLHRADFPTLHIGNRMLVRKVMLIDWLKEQQT